MRINITGNFHLGEMSSTWVDVSIILGRPVTVEVQLPWTEVSLF